MPTASQKSSAIWAGLETIRRRGCGVSEGSISELVYYTEAQTLFLQGLSK